jgi:hypothetical protein
MAERGFLRQLTGMLRQYEGHLTKLEGQLLILRGKAKRATGEGQIKLAELLSEVERGVDGVRAAGRTALEGLERATEAGQTLMGQMKDRLAEAEAAAPTVLAKGRAAVQRAAIEAKALRHGVKVGIRVARRVSKRVKAASA